LTNENVFKIAYLAEVWEVPAIRHSAQRFIENAQNSDDLLITHLSFSFAHRLPTGDLESILRVRIRRYLSPIHQQFAALPLELLHRAVDFPSQRDDFDLLFAFCAELLKVRGPSASVLFASLDFSLLSAQHISVLRCCSFEWSFASHGIGSWLVRQDAEIAAQRNCIDELRSTAAALVGQVDDMKAQRARDEACLAAISGRIDELTGKVDELRGNMDRALQQPAAEMKAIEQTFAGLSLAESLSQVEREIGALKLLPERQEELMRQIQNASKGLAELDTRHTHCASKLAAHESAAAELNAKAASLTKEVAAFKAAIAELRVAFQ
jgi:uncharacterized protein YukE